MPKVAQIGLLIAGGSLETPAVRANVDVTRQGFTELGYVEGQNITLEQRADDRMPLAAGRIWRTD
jgi:hypothetical protein